MQQKEWQGFSLILKELLQLKLSPVSVRCRDKKSDDEQDAVKKIRMCRAILSAANGLSVKLFKENNACFGASWHLGFHKIKDEKVLQMVKKFIVEGEKLFSSYQALDNLIAQMGSVPENLKSCYILEPMESAEDKPEVVIFVCNAEQACRLLTFVTFFDGKMPKIQIGGPTCRMSIVYPLLSGETNISFFDYTARKLCKVEEDKLLVSTPYSLIPKIISNIDTCSGGRAKIEFPQEFREFLQKRLVKGA